MCSQLSARGLQHFKCNLVDIDRLPFLIFASEQDEDAIEYFAGATTVAYYPVQICRHLVDVGWNLSKKSPCRASIRRNRRQWLSYFVSDRGHNRLNIC